MVSDAPQNKNVILIPNIHMDGAIDEETGEKKNRNDNLLQQIQYMRGYGRQNLFGIHCPKRHKKI